MPLLLKSGRDKAVKERFLGQQQPAAHLAVVSSARSAPAAEMKRSESGEENPTPNPACGGGAE